jgi:GNAT superfamily N-acetyltransferase
MSQSSLVYRELRRSDAASFESVIKQALGLLEKSTGLDEVAILQFRTLGNRSTWAILSLLKALGRAPIKVFVAVEGGRVLGTASLISLPRAAYVLGVATDSAARRRGIATHLLEMAHSEARARGKEWVALDVESENETAIGLYRKLGYHDAGKFDWYVGTAQVQQGQAGALPTVSRTDMGGIVAWVDGNTPQEIREALPPDEKRLSHLELIIQSLRSPTATWQVRGPGGTEGVSRGTYLSLVKTGFILPVLPEADNAAETLGSFVSQGERWIQSLGGSRIVVAFRHQDTDWGPTLAGFGLVRAVATNLMTKPMSKQKAALLR